MVAATKFIKHRSGSRMISEGDGVGIDLINLPYLLHAFRKTGVSKQCRPCSDAVFSTHSAILHTFIGSKMNF